VLAVIGLASVVEDLRSWARLIAATYGWLEEVSPTILAALMSVAGVLHAVIQIYRGVIHPLIDFLTGWLPLDLSPVAKDVLAIAFFLSWGTLRARGRRWRHVLEHGFHAQIAPARAAARFGLTLSSPSGEVISWTRALSGYYHDRPAVGQPRPSVPELAELFEKDLALARLLNGERFDEFAEAHRAEHGARSVAFHRKYRAETRLLVFVWIVGGLVALLFVSDMLLFGRAG
jgi:hypothetical protein